MNSQPSLSTPSAPRRSLTLFALVAVSALPFVGAALLMAFPDLLPDGQAQRGTLFDPVAPLAARAFTDLAGRPLDERALRGKWTLAWLGETPCDAACDRPLGTLQRIRRALSENSRKAQVAAFLLAPPADADWAARMRDDPGTLVVAGPPDSLMQVAAQVRAPIKVGDPPHPFFILDPRAQPVLHYAADVDYKDVLKDLQRLVKYVDIQ